MPSPSAERATGLSADEASGACGITTRLLLSTVLPLRRSTTSVSCSGTSCAATRRKLSSRSSKRTSPLGCPSRAPTGAELEMTHWPPGSARYGSVWNAWLPRRRIVGAK